MFGNWRVVVTGRKMIHRANREGYEMIDLESMPQVVGFAAEFSAGKDTAAEILLRLDPTARVFSFSRDVINPILNTLKLPEARRNQQLCAEGLERTGRGGLANSLRHVIQVSGHKGRAVITGVRWDTDVEMILSCPRHFLVYIEADDEICFHRARKRQQKVGESDMAWEEFLALRQAPNEVHIKEIKEKANVVLNNNGTLEDLERQIVAMYANHLAGVI